MKNYEKGLSLLFIALMACLAVMVDSRPGFDVGLEKNKRKHLPSRLKGSQKRPNDINKVVLELTRYGSRSISFAPFATRDWLNKEGKDQLTEIGKRQAYNLGLNTRLRFKDLLVPENGGLNVTEYVVVSGLNGTTLESAFSHMMGLLQNYQGKDLQFASSDIRLQPPLVQGKEVSYDLKHFNFKTALPNGFETFPILGDQPLFFPTCPKLHKLDEKLKFIEIPKENSLLSNSTGIKDLYDQIISFYKISDDYINKVMKNRTKFEILSYIADFAEMDYYNSPNPILTPKNNPELFSRLRRVLAAKETFVPKYMTKVHTTPIYLEVMRWFKLASQNKTKVKYALLSGDGSNLADFLLNGLFFNYSCNQELVTKGSIGSETQCPYNVPVGANIVWQLLTKKNDSESFFVKTSYNQKSIDLCGGQSKKDEYGDYICSLEDWMSSVNSHYLYPNFVNYCDYGFSSYVNNLESTRFGLHLMSAFAGVLAIVLIIVGICICRKIRSGRDSDNDDESYTSNEEYSTEELYQVEPHVG